jgi:hypothetical protein
MITITTGQHLNPEVLERVVAQLLAKAATADKCGLKKTAQFWRDAVINLRLQQQSRRRARLPPLCDACGRNRSDPPSKLCPGCEAYMAHQR